ncbi:hypothetical protein QE152_g31019 [Popillia japonica]|uniref:Uncharacterized protein n=1 Tax=Popillia japonica TaxID=7064 RepID=A0AAW1JCQ2_POPJA
MHKIWLNREPLPVVTNFFPQLFLYDVAANITLNITVSKSSYRVVKHQKMGIQCVDDMLNKAFFRLGFFVGRHPGYFIIVPVLLTLFFITGYQQIHHNIDPEYLFSPVNGEGKLERKIAEDLFKVNYTTRFNVARITRAACSRIFCIYS